MTAFEIYINGCEACVAGLSEPGVVTPIISWTKRENAEAVEELLFEVGGYVSRTEMHLGWLNQELKVGDEVRIVVTEKDKVSKSKKKRRESAAMREKLKLEYLKQLAKELGFVLSKKERG